MMDIILNLAGTSSKLQLSQFQNHHKPLLRQDPDVRKNLHFHLMISIEYEYMRIQVRVAAKMDTQEACTMNLSTSDCFAVL